MRPKPLKDDNGTINKAYKIVPQNLQDKLLKAIAELEDNECHRKQAFQHTNFHKLKGVKTNVYRAYIDKTSGWRLHVQYGGNGYLELNDVLTGKEHDDAAKVVKTRKGRYEK